MSGAVVSSAIRVPSALGVRVRAGDPLTQVSCGKTRSANFSRTFSNFGGIWTAQ
jgi:hypothetical protein